MLFSSDGRFLRNIVNIHGNNIKWRNAYKTRFMLFSLRLLPAANHSEKIDIT